MREGRKNIKNINICTFSYYIKQCIFMVIIVLYMKAM